MSHFLLLKTHLEGIGVKKESSTSFSSTSSVAKAVPVQSDLLTLQKALNRDFKIKGSIGYPGQKDKLTFSSLIHQISIVEKNGLHSDHEICENNLTQSFLRPILHAHFQVKDSTTRK